MSAREKTIETAFKTPHEAFEAIHKSLQKSLEATLVEKKLKDDTDIVLVSRPRLGLKPYGEEAPLANWGNVIGYYYQIFVSVRGSGEIIKFDVGQSRVDFDSKKLCHINLEITPNAKTTDKFALIIDCQDPKKAEGLKKKAWAGMTLAFLSGASPTPIHEEAKQVVVQQATLDSFPDQSGAAKTRVREFLHKCIIFAEQVKSTDRELLTNLRAPFSAKGSEILEGNTLDKPENDSRKDYKMAGSFYRGMVQEAFGKLPKDMSEAVAAEA